MASLGGARAIAAATAGGGRPPVVARAGGAAVGSARAIAVAAGELVTGVRLLDLQLHLRPQERFLQRPPAQPSPREPAAASRVGHDRRDAHSIGRDPKQCHDVAHERIRVEELVDANLLVHPDCQHNHWKGADGQPAGGRASGAADDKIQLVLPCDKHVGPRRVGCRWACHRVEVIRGRVLLRHINAVPRDNELLHGRAIREGERGEYARYILTTRMTAALGGGLWTD